MKTMDEQNVFDNPDVSSNTYRHLAFDKTKIHSGGKTESSTNGAGQTGWQQVEDCKQIRIYFLHKIQLQLNQEPQLKTIYPESDRGERGGWINLNSLAHEKIF